MNIEQARKQERDAIVAWLRKTADDYMAEGNSHPDFWHKVDWGAALFAANEGIERGDHLEGEA